MSITNTNATVTYTGNGAQLSFPITFDLQNNTQVFASKKNTTTLVVTPLVVGVDFTVVGGNPGTSITTTVAPTASEELTVYRSTPQTQPYDFLNNSGFLAEDLERALDRIVMLVQEAVAGTSSGTQYNIITFGGRFSQRVIAAATGITQTLSDMSITASEQVIFVRGAGGENVVTANPQIQAGTVLAQKMTIIGTSDTFYFVLSTGNGLVLNGEWKSTSNSVLDLRWDGSNWLETGRTLGV